MGFTFRRLDKSTWFKSHNVHSQARFLSHMSARLREDWRQKKHCLRLNLQLSAHCIAEEAEAELDDEDAVEPH